MAKILSLIYVILIEVVQGEETWFVEIFEEKVEMNCHMFGVDFFTGNRRSNDQKFILNRMDFFEILSERVEKACFSRANNRNLAINFAKLTMTVKRAYNNVEIKRRFVVM